MEEQEMSPTNPFESLAEDATFVILDLLHGQYNNDQLDLKSFSLVCNLFRSIESRHRRKLKLLGPELLPRILRRYPHLTHFGINLCPRISDKQLISISEAYRSTLQSIDLEDSMLITHKGLSNLVANCSGLVEIDLSDANWLTDYAAVEIAGARKLEVLKLGNCKLISDLTLGTIAAMCKKMRIVSLDGCSLVTDIGVEILARNCKEIRCLNLSYLPVTKKCLPAFASLQYLKELILVGCAGIDDEDVLTLRQCCKSLETLNLSNCKNVRHVGFFPPSNGAVGFLRNSSYSCWVLHSIKLDGCPITSYGIKAIGNLSSSLKKLSLYECFGVTDEGLSSVVQRHRQLKKLNIGKCYSITSAFIDCLTKSCTSLTSLKMESCRMVSKEAYVLIGQCCPLLEKLDLGDSNIDNEGLKSISRCSKLVKLYLGDCRNVADDGLSFVGLNCPKLKWLSLRRCRRITDEGIAVIAHGCPTLGLVDLSYCNKVGDNSLISLSTCSWLKVLLIQACSRVSSKGLSAIAVGCRQLLMLSIKHCSNISDDGMLSLALNSRNLIKISAAYCSITDVGLSALASINRLQNINTSFVPGLTRNGVAAALLTCGGLTNVKLDASFKSSLHESLIRNMEARGVAFHWKPFGLPQIPDEFEQDDLDED